ncbi:hypothetical protein CCM_06467 [Cordyceps militaris CM01]|uniref:Uncharacterized protein n=1 Tax=Cordyceps militaris (strain CM01) TaxID=983644 RepID=G3JML1_CORMM|nr:uncharacterized protein CCM_06467 [Cordyceps militaris CM01]EGX90047.1 hypothetical protein CCM_06467 [Cordyceps militaris CM01]
MAASVAATAATAATAPRKNVTRAGVGMRRETERKRKRNGSWWGYAGRVEAMFLVDATGADNRSWPALGVPRCLAGRVIAFRKPWTCNHRQARRSKVEILSSFSCFWLVIEPERRNTTSDNCKLRRDCSRISSCFGYIKFPRRGRGWWWSVQWPPRPDQMPTARGGRQTAEAFEFCSPSKPRQIIRLIRGSERARGGGPKRFSAEVGARLICISQSNYQSCSQSVGSKKETLGQGLSENGGLFVCDYLIAIRKHMSNKVAGCIVYHNAVWFGCFATRRGGAYPALAEIEGAWFFKLARINERMQQLSGGSGEAPWHDSTSEEDNVELADTGKDAPAHVAGDKVEKLSS